jgi:hypothetical protein
MKGLHHRILRTAGWAGLLGGIALAGLSFIGSNELLTLAGGYGMLSAGSAFYLLVGLRVRETLAARRAGPARVTSAG